MNEIVWIDKHETLTIHAQQVAEHGGSDDIRDEGLHESALARAQNPLAYSEEVPSLPRLAAAYGFGIARNHPFVDGNKRTAAVVSETFLILNHLSLDATDAELVVAFLALAAGELGEDELAGWFRERVRG